MITFLYSSPPHTLSIYLTCILTGKLWMVAFSIPMVEDESTEDGKDEGHPHVAKDEEEAQAVFLVLVGGEEGVLEPDPVGSVEDLWGKCRKWLKTWMTRFRNISVTGRGEKFTVRWCLHRIHWEGEWKGGGEILRLEEKLESCEGKML